MYKEMKPREHSSHEQDPEGIMMIQVDLMNGKFYTRFSAVQTKVLIPGLWALQNGITFSVQDLMKVNVYKEDFPNGIGIYTIRFQAKHFVEAEAMINGHVTLKVYFKHGNKDYEDSNYLIMEQLTTEHMNFYKNQ